MGRSEECGNILKSSIERLWREMDNVNNQKVVIKQLKNENFMTIPQEGKKGRESDK